MGELNPSDISNFFSQDGYGEINQQIAWLEGAIAEELGNLRILSSELKYLEKELNNFLTDYYAQVGHLFEELRQIDLIIKSIEKNKRTEFRLSPQVVVANDHQKQGGFGENDEEQEDDLFGEEAAEEIYSAPDIEHKAVEDELRRIYRKLAKICHPDMFPNDPYAKEIFAIIGSSYKNRDLATLIKIEQTFIDKKKNMAENSIEKLERLEKQYDSLLKESDSTKLRKHHLINSSGYKLRQKVLWHKMCGEDLIATTKNRVSSQIAEKREYLYIKYGKILPNYIVRDRNYLISQF